jgi:hypothetical protein
MTQVVEPGQRFFKIQSFTGPRPAVLEALDFQVADTFFVPQRADHKRGYDLRYLDPYSLFQFERVRPLHDYVSRIKNVVLVIENLEIRKKCRKKLSNM